MYTAAECQPVTPIILRRIVVALPTLILVSMLVFALQKLLPGDPALTMAGGDRDPAVLEYLRDKYRLDDPIPVQYFAWIGQVVQGDFGISLRTDAPVTELIAQKLPVTIQLAAMAMVFALLIGIPAGIIAAVRKGTAVDYAANVFALSGLSIPTFWLGIMLILLVSVEWRLLPASGYVPLSEDPWLSLKTMLMPAFVLGTALAATLMRHTRSAMLGVLRSDYIRTARAKGLLGPAVVLKHAFRNALVPIVTLVTLLFGELLAGAVLTEQVFTIPGFGKLIVDAVFNRDYAVVQGVVLCTAIGFIVMNLLADILMHRRKFAARVPVMIADAMGTEAAPPERRGRGLEKYLRNRSAVVGAILVLAFVLLAILAPLVTPQDPLQTSFTAIRKAPSAAHWLGTDDLGRDIYTRLAYGARSSLMAGVISVAIALAVGVPFGLMAGYYGGLVDGAISRAAEAMLAIPLLILAITLAAFLGPSLSNAMIAIGLSAMPIFIRLTRDQVLSVKTEDYVESARAIGLPDRWIILRYILPNALPPLLVPVTLAVATAILAEASLSFLGLGQQPPNPSWGSMLNTAKNFISQAPWMSIFPGSAIFLVVLGFNLLGDGLRDALDQPINSATTAHHQ